jgi:hypothetical protein
MDRGRAWIASPPGSGKHVGLTPSAIVRGWFEIAETTVTRTLRRYTASTSERKFSSVAVQLAPSRNQRVVTFADVWAQFHTPTLRIWREPKELLVCALIP